MPIARLLFLLAMVFALSRTMAQHIGGYSAPGSVMSAAPTPEWGKALRPCPCLKPGERSNDGWALLPRTIPNTTTDTVTCYRSYPLPTDRPTRAGQNCCYDRHGALYNQGPLVGLPDKVGTCIGEEIDGTVILDPNMLPDHTLEDLLPRDKAGALANGWLERQKDHPPNRGARCKTNGILPVIPEEMRVKGFTPYSGSPQRPGQ